MPKNPEIKKVLVLGSGPIVIGQAAEFDYAGTQACRSLKEEGLEVVLLNAVQREPGGLGIFRIHGTRGDPRVHDRVLEVAPQTLHHVPVMMAVRPVRDHQPRVVRSEKDVAAGRSKSFRDYHTCRHKPRASQTLKSQ